MFISEWSVASLAEDAKRLTSNASHHISISIRLRTALYSINSRIHEK